MSIALPPSLPFEVNQQVLSYIEDEELDTILACSLVSWSFANACRSRRFGTLELGRNDIERQKHLATNPHLIALTKCLILFNNGYDETILPSILAAVSNVVELRLWHFRSECKGRFIDNTVIHKALVKHVAPMVIRLELEGRYKWPLSALNDFTSLRSLSFSMGGYVPGSLPDEVVDWEKSDSAPGRLESLCFRVGESAKEPNLATFHRYLCSRNHKIKQIIWAISMICDYELYLSTPKQAFCEFFRVNSTTLTSLVVTTCGTKRITLGTLYVYRIFASFAEIIFS